MMASVTSLIRRSTIKHCRLARHIAAVAAPGAPVGIFLPNGAKFPVAVLSALAAGCPIVAFDQSFPEARNALIVKHAGMKAIVADDTTRGPARLLDPTIPVLDFAATVDDGAASWPPGSPNNLAMICYTSGSTGQPKGVLHSHRNLLHDVKHRIKMTHLTADEPDGTAGGNHRAIRYKGQLSPDF